MSAERKQNKYLADFAQKNEERQKKMLRFWIRTHKRPKTIGTQVKNQKSLSPFSNILTTLMIFVVSDMSEAHRERLFSSLSLRGMNVPACTFEAVRTVFVELFCAPKCSMENLSLRVSGHCGCFNRTFIVEECSEDDFGQWATDEITAEQGHIDDERSCLWTCDDNECPPTNYLCRINSGKKTVAA